MKNKAVFFDKDGTLVKNIPYNVDPSRVMFTEGAEIILNELKEKYRFHIISNQSGVALGLINENELKLLGETLSEMFQRLGAELEAFHYCPHHPKDLCKCRKPGGLLFELAAEKFGIDLKQSWMIGDILDDIEAGKRVGCRTVLLNNGNETEWIVNEMRQPDFMVKDLGEAAKIIMEEDGIA